MTSFESDAGFGVRRNSVFVGSEIGLGTDAVKGGISDGVKVALTSTALVQPKSENTTRSINPQ